LAASFLCSTSLSPPQQITLSDEEIVDVSLSTFTVFDHEAGPLCDISRNLPGALDVERVDGEAAGGDAEGSGAAAGAAAAPMANSRQRVVYALIFLCR
jgi:hypothetical protein